MSKKDYTGLQDKEFGAHVGGLLRLRAAQLSDATDADTLAVRVRSAIRCNGSSARGRICEAIVRVAAANGGEATVPLVARKARVEQGYVRLQAAYICNRVERTRKTTGVFFAFDAEGDTYRVEVAAKAAEAFAVLPVPKAASKRKAIAAPDAA